MAQVRIRLLAFALSALLGASACGDTSSDRRAAVASAQDPSATARRAHEAFLAWIGERAARPAADREPSFLARGMDLAQQRGESLSALLRVDPSAAIDLALPDDVRARLPAAIRDRVETHFEADGDLLVVAVLPGGDSPPVQYFARVDGSVERAYIAGPAPARTQMATRLLGIRLGRERVVVRSQVEAAQATTSPPVLGAKRFLYMRVDFSDAPGHPETQQAVLNLLNNTVGGFFSQVSFGKMSFTADSPPAVLRMPQTAAAYRSMGEVALLGDARVVAKAAGFDTANYDYDAVSTASGLGIIGGTANAFVGGKSSFYNAPVTQAIFAHELGHNFGSVHAHMWQPANLDPASTVGSFIEYGNGTDVMGSEDAGSLAMLDYNVVIKTLFGWLGSSDILPVTASGTYHLTASDAATTGGVRALKIAEAPGLDYWVEYRSTRTNYPLVKNGAMVVRSPQDGSSSLLEMNINGPFDTADAPLSLGQTFFDPAVGVTVTPVSKTTTSPPSMDVVVNFGPFSGNQAPTGTASASATTVGVGSNITFRATVSDADGDPLVYHWTFEDQTVNPGTATVTKSFAANGYYAVRCAVSDMRGGTFSKNFLVTVGTPAGQAPVSGVVTLGGAGLGEVAVSDGVGSAGLTDTAGAYTFILGSQQTITATPLKAGFSFSPASTTVTIGTQPITGINFSASCAPGDCGSDGGVDAGPDATVDAGTDASVDATADAGLDAGGDGGSCETSSGGSFVNTPMTSQNETFTAEVDASVSASPSNTVIGLSQGAQSTYGGFSALVRFNTSGLFDAYDATTAGYHATNNVSYTAGAFYHVRLVVDVGAQTYSAFVTPPGQQEQAIASAFAFRTAASSLTSWAVNTHSGNGTGTACNFTSSCAPGNCGSDGGVDGGPDATVDAGTEAGVDASHEAGVDAAADAGLDAGGDGGSCETSSGGSFVNTPMTSQTGTFTAEVDASVSASPSNTVIGLSQGPQSTYGAFSALVRFNTSGLFDAYDATTAGYHATNNVSYTAGAFYHVRLVVDVAAQTYSAFVTPPGQQEQAIASGFTFRTAASSLTSWAINTHSGNGTGTACNFTPR